MPYYIYKLMHPITKEVRYVGQTKSLKNRLHQHICNPYSSDQKIWIKSLKDAGLRPIIKTIIKSDNFSHQLENYFIGYYSRKSKFTLFNRSYGYVNTLEYWRKRLKSKRVIDSKNNSPSL